MDSSAVAECDCLSVVATRVMQQRAGFLTEGHLVNPPATWKHPTPPQFCQKVSTTPNTLPKAKGLDMISPNAYMATESSIPSLRVAVWKLAQTIICWILASRSACTPGRHTLHLFCIPSRIRSHLAGFDSAKRLSSLDKMLYKRIVAEHKDCFPCQRGLRHKGVLMYIYIYMLMVAFHNSNLTH